MSNRKEELLKELAELIKVEQEEKEKNKNSRLIVKSGIIQKTLWIFDTNIEIEAGVYSISETLGSPSFRVGDIVVLLEPEKGQRAWYHKSDNGNYDQAFMGDSVFENDMNPKWIEIIEH